MGVNLRDLISKKPIRLEDLTGKSIAIDAYNTLYQFLAIIRQPNGTPLKDNNGRITSHLSGLLYRTSNLIEKGVKPIYVFDGVSPSLKEKEIERRVKIKETAKIKYEAALKVGKIKEARKYAQATSRLQDYMEEDSKELLDFMGVPWIQAPGEGEAQIAHIVKLGDADYCASQDYDSLLFGATRLIRNLTISGRRKLPRKDVYVEVLPEIVELGKILKEFEITQEQLIDIGILIGTDFNPGIKGLGSKTAIKLIKKHGNIENVLLSLEKPEFPVEPKRVKDIFLKPNVINDYKIEWKKPDEVNLRDFLCRERAFSKDRVNRALDKIIMGLKELKSRTTLEKWF